MQVYCRQLKTPAPYREHAATARQAPEKHEMVLAGRASRLGMGLIMEIVVTFVLVFVIFATAVDSGGMGHMAPLAIGLAVLVDHILAVSVTGASMNPARSFGPAVMAQEWSDHWVYWIAPLIGGGLAGMVYQFAFVNRPR